MKKFMIIFGLLVFSSLLFGQVDAKDPWETAKDNIAEQLMGEGPVPDGSFSLPEPEKFNEVGANTSMRDYILLITNFALTFLGIIAVVMVIYAGFRYVTDAGDDGGKEAGKKILMYVAIGIIVVLLSYALVNTLIGAGLGEQDTGSTTEQVGDEEEGMVEEGDGQDGNAAIGDADVFAGDSNLIGIPEQEGVKEISDDLVAVDEETAAAGVDFVAPPGAEEVLWDFGDGTQSSSLDPNHKFGTTGANNVKMIAKMPNGEVIYTQKVFLIGGVTAYYKNNDNITAGGSAVFEGYATSAIGTITSYDWTCQNLGSSGCFNDGTGRYFSTEFASAGTYAVTLTVGTSTELTKSYTKQITVLASRPIASAEYSYIENYKEPSKYKFDAKGSTNVKGTTNGLIYEWNFGEEENLSQATTGRIVEHMFKADGEKTIELTVIEKGLASDVLEITIPDVRTIGVDFLPPYRPIDTGKTFTFKADSSVEKNEVDYEWFFPEVDGVVVEDDLHLEEVRAHFTEPGVYKVSLVGKQDTNESLLVTKNIYVKEQGMPLSVIEVTFDGEVVQEPFSMERGSGEFNLKSLSVDEFGNAGEDAELTETWSVNGQVVSNVAQISAMFDQIKDYYIKLKTSRPGNPNVSSTAEFKISVKNALPVFLPTDIQYPLTSNSELNINFPIEVKAIDPDGEIVKYKYELMEQGQVVDTQITESSIAYFNLDQYPGEHSYYVRATVTDDNWASKTVTNTLLMKIESTRENTIPTVELNLLNRVNQGDTGTYWNLQAVAVDADGDKLSYKWVVVGQEHLLFPNKNSFSYKFEEPGGYTIQVEVTDGHGEIVTDTIKINVEEKVSYNSTKKKERI